MLEEIDKCRQAGFVRAAFTLAMCVPDVCRKATSPPIQYEAWCKQYGGGVLLEFADGLYAVRNCTVHEMCPAAKFKLDFSDAAVQKFPAQVRAISLPAKYQTINAGALISDIIGAGHRFYMVSSTNIKVCLDSVDANLMVSYFI